MFTSGSSGLENTGPGQVSWELPYIGADLTVCPLEKHDGWSRRGPRPHVNLRGMCGCDRETLHRPCQVQKLWQQRHFTQSKELITFFNSDEIDSTIITSQNIIHKWYVWNVSINCRNRKPKLLTATCCTDKQGEVVCPVQISLYLPGGSVSGNHMQCSTWLVFTVMIWAGSSPDLCCFGAMGSLSEAGTSG